MLDPSCLARWMWRSMTADGCARWSSTLAVTAGSARAAGGWSHSWVTATTSSPAPMAKSSSVALGSSETTRRGAAVRKLLGRCAAPGRARLADGAQQADHLHGRQSSVGALVARLSTRPVERLLEVLSGDHPEARRHPGGGMDSAHPARRLSGDQVVVAGL